MEERSVTIQIDTTYDVLKKENQSIPNQAAIYQIQLVKGERL